MNVGSFDSITQDKNSTPPFIYGGGDTGMKTVGNNIEKYRSYRNIGVSDGHHSLSHHQGDHLKQMRIREINRFHARP